MTRIHLIAMISLTTVIFTVNAIPQLQHDGRLRRQNNFDDEQLIGDIFGSTSEAPPPPTPPRRRGPNDIITSDPTFVPTVTPQFATVNEEICTCVPYHMCDPRTNRTKSQESDDEVTGWGKIDIRFDAHECQAVLDVCCFGVDNATVYNPPPPTTPPPKPSEAGCGVRNVGGLDFEVAGAYNYEAGFGEFPWTVAIIRIDDDVAICGGSLIHPKAVLTGNHCVRDYVLRANELKIRAGEWDTQTTKERLPFQERLPSRIFSHPNYNVRSLANDIAIVELEDPFQMDRHISTVCLPPSGFVPNQQDCFASGWGKKSFGQAGIYSVIMKSIPLPIVDFFTCQAALQADRLGPKFRLDQSFICAGGVEGVDTCEGDGGAPLVCPIGRPGENRYAQNGIVAWGLDCNKPVPAVYANVPMAREWIDGQIRLIGLDTNYYTYRN